ncbi:hypothetical protein, partial [Mycobacterium ulcerans]|uniref:hypothetical protein n=1 Tax=Mycobacterium ulcerans TaxID=1809 RepID=UPI003F6FA2FA
TNSNQLDRSPDSPCLHSGPNSAAPKIINPAHKPANQQRRSPGSNPDLVIAQNTFNLAQIPLEILLFYSQYDEF